MKTALIVAALCAAVITAPFGAQAAITKLTDHDLYCSFRPLTSKCSPAKPVKPIAKLALTTKYKVGHIGYSCVKRTDGKPYLMSCSWK